MLKSLLVSALLLWPAIAWASSDVTGTVDHLDWTTRQISLADGKRYSVVRGIDMGRFKAGDRVTIRVEDEGGKELITKMTLGETFPRPQAKKPFHKLGL
jgi:hypothetical protein